MVLNLNMGPLGKRGYYQKRSYTVVGNNMRGGMGETQTYYIAARKAKYAVAPKWLELDTATAPIPVIFSNFVALIIPSIPAAWSASNKPVPGDICLNT